MSESYEIQKCFEETIELRDKEIANLKATADRRTEQVISLQAALRWALEDINSLLIGLPISSNEMLDKAHALVKDADAGVSAVEREIKGWKLSAQMIGEKLADTGPDGYYDMDSVKWYAWASKAVDAKKALSESAETKP